MNVRTSIRDLTLSALIATAATACNVDTDDPDDAEAGEAAEQGERTPDDEAVGEGEAIGTVSSAASSRAPSCIKRVDTSFDVISDDPLVYRMRWRLKSFCRGTYAVSLDVSRSPDPPCRRLTPGASAWFSYDVHHFLHTSRVVKVNAIKRC